MSHLRHKFVRQMHDINSISRPCRSSPLCCFFSKTFMTINTFFFFFKCSFTGVFKILTAIILNCIGNTNKLIFFFFTFLNTKFQLCLFCFTHPVSYLCTYSSYFPLLQSNKVRHHFVLNVELIISEVTFQICKIG